MDAGAKPPEGVDTQAAIVIPPLRQVLSAELQIYLETIKSLLQKTQRMPDTASGGPFYGLPSAHGAFPIQVFLIQASLQQCAVNFCHVIPVLLCAGSQDAAGSTKAAQRAQYERALLASLANDPGKPTYVHLRSSLRHMCTCSIHLRPGVVR